MAEVRKLAVIGDPIAHSLSPLLHNTMIRELGLPYTYEACRVSPDALDDWSVRMREEAWVGCNATMPHKLHLIPRMDCLTEAAQYYGAVNTVRNDNGVFTGHNTDGEGFAKMLSEHGLGFSGAKVTILGAGGAARAISVECALAKARKIIIANIVREEGEALVKMITEKTGVPAEFIMWDHAVRVPEEVDIFSNATSVGLYPHTDQKPNVDYDTIRPELVVTDVIFNDPHSLFLQEAEKRGARTINGLGMLVNQGALNFKLWTGVEPQVEVMKDVLKREFGLEKAG